MPESHLRQPRAKAGFGVGDELLRSVRRNDYQVIGGKSVALTLLDTHPGAFENVGNHRRNHTNFFRPVARFDVEKAARQSAQRRDRIALEDAQVAQDVAAFGKHRRFDHTGQKLHALSLELLLDKAPLIIVVELRINFLFAQSFADAFFFCHDWLASFLAVFRRIFDLFYAPEAEVGARARHGAHYQDWVFPIGVAM